MFFLVFPPSPLAGWMASWIVGWFEIFWHLLCIIFHLHVFPLILLLPLLACLLAYFSLACWLPGVCGQDRQRNCAFRFLATQLGTIWGPHVERFLAPIFVVGPVSMSLVESILELKSGP